MSQKHPGARKRQQDKSHDPDDAFIARVLQISEWGRRHSQLVTVIVIAAAALVAAGVYYRNYQRGQVQRAAQDLEDIHQTIATDDREGARSQLVTFLQRYGGTRHSGEARLLLGAIYLDGDEPQQAAAVLEPLGSSPRSPLELQAATLLAAAYEQDGRGRDAEASYLRVADRSELSFQVNEALGSAARLRAARGDLQGAADLYVRILEDLDEGDRARGVYEMRLQELRTAAKA